MLIHAVCALAIGFTTSPQAGGGRPARPPVQIGWHDEFARTEGWRPIAMENMVQSKLLSPGSLRLSLAQVPSGWPYTFQWSGLKRDLHADIAHYPILMAYVGPVQGYAHLDLDVLDADAKPVKTIRSSTLNVTAVRMPRRPGGFEGPGAGPVTVSGVVYVDLAKELLPATYSFQIRLIVGGENSGCSAVYHWVRFVARKDWEWLAAFPGYRLWDDGRHRAGRTHDKIGF